MNKNDVIFMVALRNALNDLPNAGENTTDIDRNLYVLMLKKWSEIFTQNCPWKVTHDGARFVIEEKVRG